MYYIPLGMYHMRNGLTSSGGAHIVIEDGTAMPLVLPDGISIASGTETMISLKTHMIRRLKSPYGSQCENKITNEELKLMYPSEFKYSTKVCNRLCYSAITNRECNCYVPADVGGVMLYEYDLIKKTFKRCETKKQSECIIEVRKTYKTCDCHPECQSIIYQVIASRRLF